MLGCSQAGQAPVRLVSSSLGLPLRAQIAGRPPLVRTSIFRMYPTSSEVGVYMRPRPTCKQYSSDDRSASINESAGQATTPAGRPAGVASMERPPWNGAAKSQGPSLSHAATVTCNHNPLAVSPSTPRGSGDYAPQSSSPC